MKGARRYSLLHLQAKRSPRLFYRDCLTLDTACIRRGPRRAGGTLTGTQGAEGNSTEIFEGTVSGDDVAWKVSITNPMPLTLAFTGKVAGDSISGEMGIGPMGSFPFTGTRA